MSSYLLAVSGVFLAYLLARVFYRAVVNGFLLLCDAYDDLDYSFLRSDYEN